MSISDPYHYSFTLFFIRWRWRWRWKGEGGGVAQVRPAFRNMCLFYGNNEEDESKLNRVT